MTLAQLDWHEPPITCRILTAMCMHVYAVARVASLLGIDAGSTIPSHGFSGISKFGDLKNAAAAMKRKISPTSRSTAGRDLDDIASARRHRWTQ